METDLLLERSQWDLSWVPADCTVIDRPDLGLVACPRDSSYLNMVVRTRADPAALPALVEEVRAAHAGVGSRWLVCAGNRSSELEAALSAGGYRQGVEHQVRVLEADEFRPRGAKDLAWERVESEASLLDWHAVTEAGFARANPRTAEELAQELAACRSPEGRVFRFIAREAATGRPLSAGGLTLFRDLGFGLLWAGATVPDGRHQGAYSTVLGARVAWARAAGCDRVGLYARHDSSAPIVDRCGFRRYGPMWFWERPAGA